MFCLVRVEAGNCRQREDHVKPQRSETMWGVTVAIRAWRACGIKFAETDHDDRD